MKILIICFLLLFGTIIQVTDAQDMQLSSDIDKSQIQMKMDSTFQINELGVLLIEYKLTIINNSTANLIFNEPISFFLPKEYENKINAYFVESEALEIQNINYMNELVVISNNKRHTIVTIDFRNENFEIKQGEDFEISLRLMLVDVIELTEKKGLYKVLIPEITTTNFQLQQLNFEMSVPETATYANISAHYTRTSFQIYDIATTIHVDIKPMFGQKFEYFFLTETEGSNAFSKVEVEEIVREIFITKNGKIMIKENLKIINKGFYDLKYIQVNLIGPEVDENGVPLAKTITTMPNREPALNEKKLVILLSPPQNRLNIVEILRVGIPEGQSADITFVYALPEAYINHNFNSITVTIPIESPLFTISDKYSIVINSPDSFSIKTKSMITEFKDREQLSGKNITIEITPTLSWASMSIIPISSLIFITIFLGLSIYKEKPKEEEEKEIVKKTRELLAKYSEKITYEKNIFSGLINLSSEKVQQEYLSNIKNELTSIKNRYANVLGQLKREISDLDNTQKEKINKINQLEQSLERDIFQITKSYEQLNHENINKNDFEKRINQLQKDVEKRINEILSILNQMLDSIR